MAHRKFEESSNKSKALIHQLNSIGIRLSAEKNIDNLTLLILEECMHITNSDGGSIYIKETDGEKSWITFTHTLNVSRAFPFKSFTLPISNTSFSGYCAATGKTLNFSSLHDTESLVGIRHNDTFDKMNNYQTKNMLVIPMKDMEGNVIGVLQLINKKKSSDIRLLSDEDYEDAMEPYTADEEEIITSLASQTAILFERTRLYEEINELFRTFSESMVTALDKRDPVTAGHSKRVADYAVALANAMNGKRSQNGEAALFSEEDLKMLYYSGLLHDIGKVGVSETVLAKGTRLGADRLNAIKFRFQYVKTQLVLKSLSEQLTDSEVEILDNIDTWKELVIKFNNRGFMAPEELESVRTISTHTYTDEDGATYPLLDPFEFDALSVMRGNLTASERKEIESHSQMTLEVLNEIKWSQELKEVPFIAGSHHEKLNGKGYPMGRTSDEIPYMSKILAIVDIFDALTASDRPYKPAMPVDKTMKILMEEVDNGALDPELTKIFIDDKPYAAVFEKSFPTGHPS